MYLRVKTGGFPDFDLALDTDFIGKKCPILAVFREFFPVFHIFANKKPATTTK